VGEFGVIVVWLLIFGALMELVHEALSSWFGRL
jgi:hypothetical protein